MYIVTAVFPIFIVWKSLKKRRYIYTLWYIAIQSNTHASYIYIYIYICTYIYHYTKVMSHCETCGGFPRKDGPDLRFGEKVNNSIYFMELFAKGAFYWKRYIYIYNYICILHTYSTTLRLLTHRWLCVCVILVGLWTMVKIWAVTNSQAVNGWILKQPTCSTQDWENPVQENWRYGWELKMVLYRGTVINICILLRIIVNHSYFMNINHQISK